MGAILRSIGAVIAGFVVASIVMMMVEMFNGQVLHPELARAAAGLTDREAIRALLATAPVTAFLVVLVGWMLGAFAGGWVAARLAPRATMRHALVLGGLLTLAGIANNLMLPPPLWFWVVSVLVFVPSAWAGARLVPGR
jgi:hypothetical protein